IDTYTAERELAAGENLLNSTRSTDFITPKSAASRSFRNAVLNLAREHPLARGLANRGRLSLPTAYADTPLNTPDDDTYASRVTPGRSEERRVGKASRTRASQWEAER